MKPGKLQIIIRGKSKDGGSFLGKGPRGFTLAEIAVGTAVLALFLAGAYSMFFGGSKISNKASWLQYTVDNLRSTEVALTRAIKSSSYPSTLTPARIYDAGDGAGIPNGSALNYFIQFPLGTGTILAKDNFDKAFMRSVSCQPEKFGFPSDNCQLIMTWHQFSFIKDPNDITLGNLVWEQRVASITTIAPYYAASLTAKFEDANPQRTVTILRDVESVNIDISSVGPKPQTISLTLNCMYSKEKLTTRKGQAVAFPNVGIKTGL